MTENTKTLLAVLYLLVVVVSVFAFGVVIGGTAGFVASVAAILAAMGIVGRLVMKHLSGMG